MLRHISTFLTLLLLSLLACASAQGTNWYADPNGSVNGDGSINHPWELETALISSSIQPGDTLYLRGGTYDRVYGANAKGEDCIYRCDLAGDANHQTTIMSYPGEWARIDGGLLSGSRVNMEVMDVYGSYITIRDLELLDSNPNRQDGSTNTWTETSGKNFGFDIAPGDPNLVGTHPGIKLINCVVHDTAQGVSLWKPAFGGQVYGCLVYYNGWEGADRAHGHGIYTQNYGGPNHDQFMVLNDNIVFDQFEFGIHAYAGGDTVITNYQCYGDICFKNGSLRGAGQATADIILVNGTPWQKKQIYMGNCCTYIPNGLQGGGTWLGWGWDFNDANFITHPNPGFNIDCYITNNHFIGGNVPLQAWAWNTVTCTGNTILSNPSDTWNVSCIWGDNQSPTNYNWDYNTYIARAPYWQGCGTTRVAETTFAGWQSNTGFDAHSTCTTSPSGTFVQVRPNQYDSGRANIAIYNWTSATSVSVDLSSLNIQNGSAYWVYDAQNYFAAPLVSGTYNGSAVSIPTANADGSKLAIQAAIGNVTIAPVHTGQDFGAYVIKYTAGPPTHQAPTVNAGVDQTITSPANSVSLVGTASDDNISPAGTLVTTWSKVSGAGTVTFANANALSTTATFSTTGTYVLNLDANDGAKDSNSQCTIKVLPAAANTAPTITGLSNQTITLPNAASLNGTVSDDGLPNPPGTVVLAWTKVSGPGTVTFGTPSAAHTSATFSTIGTYVVQLDANDSALHTTAQATITVNPAGSLTMALQLPFDEGTGTTAADGSGNGRNATLAGSAGWTTGKVGAHALLGNGSSAYASVSNFSLTNEFTLAFWFQTSTTTSGYHYMFSWGTVDAANNVNVWLYQSGGATTLRTDIVDTRGIDRGNYEDVADPNSLLANGQWHHYCATVSSSAGTTVYIDGNVRMTDSANTCTTITPPNSLYIAGRSDLNAARFFNGAIDELRIYTTCLSASDVAALANPGGQTNQAPVANAGITQTIALPSTATLAGTISDDGLPNPPAACVALWTKVSGPGTVTFTNANSLSTTATFSTEGSYVLQLDANDSALHATSSVTLVADNPPTVTACAAQNITLPTNSVTVSATASDDGWPAALTYQWTKSSGPGTVTFATPTAASTAATFSTSGTYTLQISVSDGALPATDITTVTVYPGNTASTVSAGSNQTIGWPTDTVTLSGAVSDDGYPVGKTLVITWTAISGPGNVMFANANAASTVATFSTIGTYVLQLDANDGALKTDSTCTITVQATNATPVVTGLSNQTITWPTNSVSLSGTVSDDGLPNACVLLWTKVSGPGTVTFSAPAAASTNATFSTIGTYVLNLDANDSALHGDEAVTITVQLGNTAPTVSAGSNQQISLPTNTVSLSGTVSDDGLPVGSTTTCTWSKDSGTGTVTFANANAAATTATFSTTGTYVLRLTASDTALQAYSTVTITVAASGGGWTMRIQAEDFDNGGQYVAYYDTTASNAGGANYRPGEYVDIRTTTDDPNGYAVCYIVGGEWMKYTVNIPSSGLCNLKFRTCSTTDYSQVPTTNALHLLCDGTDLTPSGVNLPGTVGPTSWATTTVSNITLPSGQHVLCLQIYDGSNSWDLNWFEIDSATGTGNTAPTVSAGSNQQISLPTNTVSLSGTVSDDGLPSGTTTCTWSKDSGLGTVTFTNANAASTTATFSTTGTYVLRLTASDTALQGYGTVTITVLAGNTAPTVSAGNNQITFLPTTSVTLAGTVSDDGLPVGSTTTCTWSKDSGPGTVTFGNANAAATTATFSTVGTYILRLTASDTALQAYSTVTITVSASSGWSLRIQAEDYDTGGQGVAYYDTTTGNAGGAYRSDDVDIRTATDDPNGYAVCYIANGEWMKYTRTIPSSGSYTVKFRTSSTADYSFVATTDALHLFCDGTDVTPNGVDLPGTVGPEYWATTTVSNVNLPAGQHVLKIQVYNGAAWDFNWFEIDAQ